MRSKRAENEQKILFSIDERKISSGLCPTFREIADDTGIPLGVLHKTCKDMKLRGILEWTGHRSIRRASV